MKYIEVLTEIVKTIIIVEGNTNHIDGEGDICRIVKLAKEFTDEIVKH